MESSVAAVKIKSWQNILQEHFESWRNLKEKNFAASFQKDVIVLKYLEQYKRDLN